MSKKITIYFDGLLGISKVKATLVDHGTLPQWAQYRNVPWVSYKPFRSRTTKRILASGYRPYLLVVEGWDTPEPDSGLVPFPETSGAQFEITKSRYASCDPRWQIDFDKLISKSSVKILFDFRHTTTMEVQ